VAQEFISGVGTPEPKTERRIGDIHLVELNHKIERVADRVSTLEKNHADLRAEIKELSNAVSKLTNGMNRGIWILVGAGAVLAFLVSAQFTQTVKVGSAIVGAQ
jgi:prefoldin subunit 5